MVCASWRVFLGRREEDRWGWVCRERDGRYGDGGSLGSSD